MDFEELLSRVALAFGVGLLIGLERGWHTRDAAPGEVAIVSVYRSSSSNDGRIAVQFRNPFGFWSVLGVAVTMGVVIMLGRLIADRFGTFGAIAGAATMGFFDVDAMTVSMTRLVPQFLHRCRRADFVGDNGASRFVRADGSDRFDKRYVCLYLCMYL